MFFVIVYSKQTQSCMLILSCKHTHLFEMMCHLYFSRYKLFNYKYVHMKPNELHLNKDFLFFISFYVFLSKMWAWTYVVTLWHICY